MSSNPSRRGVKRISIILIGGHSHLGLRELPRPIRNRHSCTVQEWYSLYRRPAASTLGKMLRVLMVLIERGGARWILFGVLGAPTMVSESKDAPVGCISLC